MTIIGTRVLRKEDPKFLTVGATYTADLDDSRAFPAWPDTWSNSRTLGLYRGFVVSVVVGAAGVGVGVGGGAAVLPFGDVVDLA